MWTEFSLMAEMRAQLRNHLPDGAFLRRDRGDGLLITNAPAIGAFPDSIPDFLSERCGNLARILPDVHWIDRLESVYTEPPNYFCKTLLRFRGQSANRENLMLFAQGLKLQDAGSSAAPSEYRAYERALRQRCAAALRGGAYSGGLYACALLLAQISTFYKGETNA